MISHHCSRSVVLGACPLHVADWRCTRSLVYVQAQYSLQFSITIQYITNMCRSAQAQRERTCICAHNTCPRSMYKNEPEEKKTKVIRALEPQRLPPIERVERTNCRNVRIRGIPCRDSVVLRHRFSRLTFASNISSQLPYSLYSWSAFNLDLKLICHLARVCVCPCAFSRLLAEQSKNFQMANSLCRSHTIHLQLQHMFVNV